MKEVFWGIDEARAHLGREVRALWAEANRNLIPLGAFGFRFDRRVLTRAAHSGRQLELYAFSLMTTDFTLRRLHWCRRTAR